MDENPSSYRDRLGEIKTLNKDLVAMADVVVKSMRAEGKSDDEIVAKLASVVLDRPTVGSAVAKAMRRRPVLKQALRGPTGDLMPPAGGSDVVTKAMIERAAKEGPRPGSPGARKAAEEAADERDLQARLAKLKKNRYPGPLGKEGTT